MNLTTKLYYKTSEECRHLALDMSLASVYKVSYYSQLLISIQKYKTLHSTHWAADEPTARRNRHSEADDDAGIAGLQWQRNAGMQPHAPYTKGGVEFRCRHCADITVNSAVGIRLEELVILDEASCCRTVRPLWCFYGPPKQQYQLIKLLVLILLNVNRIFNAHMLLIRLLR